MNRMKSPLPSLLCLTSDTSDYSHSEQVGILLDAGATFIQVRSKKLSSQELLIQANYASRMAVEKNAFLIINDHIDMSIDEFNKTLNEKMKIAEKEALKIVGR